jgi:hypothetical protein
MPKHKNKEAASSVIKDVLVLVNTNLVGRCGLYCGACGIYRAYKDGGEYRQRLAEFFKCPPEKVRCEGCQVLTPDCWGNDCKIVQCLNAKGFKFCYECPDYETHTCEKFEKFSEAYLKEDGVDLRANLARIKAGEVEEWLKESEEKFRCPYCGKLLSTSALRKKCYHCGKSLSR